MYICMYIIFQITLQFIYATHFGIDLRGFFLLIKGSLVCFTLEIYKLSISFRNWTKICNESINSKCLNNVKATDEHFVYFRTNLITEWTIFFEKYSHILQTRVASPKFRQFIVSILKRLYLICVLFCYFLFFLVLNFTQLNLFQLGGRGMGGGGISVFWNCAQPANSESGQWIYLMCLTKCLANHPGS
jgi:hypothetical protein